MAKLWAGVRAAEKTLRLPFIIFLLIVGGLMILNPGSRGVIFYSIF